METYSTFEEYQEAFFPKGDQLKYSKYEDFGRILAEQHMEILREVVQEWRKENDLASDRNSS